MAIGRFAYNNWQGFGAVLWIRHIRIHMDPHHFGNLDPHPDPHPYQIIMIRTRIKVMAGSGTGSGSVSIADDKPKRMEYEPI
jgi:hypothetical protein